MTISTETTGLFNAPPTFTANDAFNPALAAPDLQNQHALNLTGLITDTAAHWRTQNFGPGATNSGNAADLANPAGDGIVNLLKYSLGLNPQTAYAPDAAITSALGTDGFLTMSVNKNPAATDVSLAIEVTGNISLPTAWSAQGTTVVQNTTTMLQARDNTAISAAPSRFIRLNVTRP